MVSGGRWYASGRYLSARRCSQPKNVQAVDNLPIVDISNYGVANNTTNQTTAVQSALDTIPAGSVLRIPAGWDVHHADKLLMRNPGIWLTGPGKLTATNHSLQALLIQADDITVSNITLENIDATTDRSPGTNTQKIGIEAVDGTVFRDLVSINSAATGVRCRGATNYILERVTVRRSWADGIHSTDGATNGQILDCWVEDSGDDMISIVSYRSDPTFCSNIVIKNCHGQHNTHGRGFTVVGGQNIRFEGGSILHSRAAGIYVVAEDITSWNTRAIANVTYKGLTLTDCNTETISAYASRIASPTTIPNHGGIMILNQQPTVLSDVWMEDIDVINVPTTRSRNCRVDHVTASGAPQPAVACNKVLFRNIRIQDGPLTNFSGGSTPNANWKQDNCTRDGVAIAAQGTWTPYANPPF